MTNQVDELEQEYNEYKNEKGCRLNTRFLESFIFIIDKIHKKYFGAQMSYVKHNKIKNTGILYELLSRQITADVINDDKKPKSVKLFKEFFNKNTELGKEYELYSILLNKKYKNLTHASSTLFEAVIKSRRKLSNRRLNNEKYNLIKTIKENYDIKEFFNTRIPNFKVMAIRIKFFNQKLEKKILDQFKKQIHQSL